MKHFKFLFFLLLLTIATSAQTSEQHLRKHVEYLASDKLEGRRTGEPGAVDAAKYIEKEFAKYKLKPGQQLTHGATYTQGFPYIAGVELGKGNSLVIGEKKLEVGVNWMPLGYSMNADFPATGVVFAGFGIIAPEANYDDYKGLDVKDKIVLVFDSTPDAGNPHSPFVRFNIHTKANIAKDKGAKAIILIAEDPDFKNDRLSKLSYDRTLGETAIPVAGITRTVGAQLLDLSDAETLRGVEDFLSTTRDKSTPGNLQQNDPAAKGANRPVGNTEVRPSASVAVKIDLVKKQVTASNVIGILPGTDPQLKDEAIVIGAHYDHLGHGGSGSLAANSTDIHHGADDNASGTSAVLELARNFAKEKKNKRTLIFMAFSGEEEGLLGSKFYVNNAAYPLDKTIAMINLDMVGRLNGNKLTVGGVGTAAEWNEAVKRRNDIMFDNDSGYGVGKKFQLQLNEDGFGPSDHSSFYGKNIPVLFFFTGTHNDYHKPSDTFEKINYEGLTRIVDYVGQIAKAIDENPTKPTYAVAKSSGQMGQVRMSVSLGTIPNYADSTDGMIIDG
ncbi:MAG TPA: M20/M25/M40 family metallo-hydrolase, partial [Pyrinomonadaceae bacterium]|nr:M20/M25/M40 family metallo-hydrolase [Pyrinomonadaceae bacterium]